MSQGITYSVDLVFCIDATSSMTPILERVKENALSFSDDLRSALDKSDKEIDALRVKILAFRDYYYDGDKSTEISEFFVLPDQNTEFRAFVSAIKPMGGGDAPETGLEALALAIQSPWGKTGTKSRQIIVVWTDASAHPLEKDAGSKPRGYPDSLPKNIDELTDMWEGQSSPMASGKRLVLFAPDGEGWSDIAASWTDTIQLPSKAGEGLDELSYATILDVLVKTVGK